MENKVTYIGNLTLNANPINIIICGTHNNRLECFFSKYFKDFKYKSKTFNNCVIIRCFKLNGHIKFNMIYEGENEEGGNKFKLSSCYKSNACWGIKEFNIYFNSINLKSLDIPDNTEIFLVRHGQGVHNKVNIFEKIYNNMADAQLNTTGSGQAERAGVFLSGYIKAYYTYINIFWEASHLVRTQQTIGLMMKQFNNINNIINIAPCTHELIYKNDGMCDAAYRQMIPINSNTPRCNSENSKTDETCKILTNFNIDNSIEYSVKINWDYYNFFYNSNLKCEETNMIDQIIRTFEF
jgi:hypothetical protein